MRKIITIAPVFMWIGFVGAISFMEAWLKFRAPGVSLAIGLGIGRIVFTALNKVEWVLLLTTMGVLYPFTNIKNALKAALLIPGIILLLQTFWMLPVLDARAELYIINAPVEPSYMHFLYIIAECVKIVSLFAAGILLIRSGRRTVS